jgi:hypothetical protein
MQLLPLEERRHHPEVSAATVSVVVRDQSICRVVRVEPAPVTASQRRSCMSHPFPESFPESAENLIREELRPGEVILAVHDFNTHDLDGTVGGAATFVVSNDRLYEFGFSRRLLGKRIDLVSANDVSLSYLGSVSHSDEKKLLRSDVLHIELRWNDGRYDHLSTIDVDGGKTFCRVLRDAHDRSRHSVTSADLSVAEQLSKLAELKGQGLLDDGDWQRAKDLFLGKAPDEREQAITNLRQLHGLRESGVLSESEFNMKKWDVLSRS